MQTNTLTTTAANNFFPCSGSNEALFAVRPGIAAYEALEMASCLIDVARTCAYESMEAENLSLATAYLTEMAKSVVDSLLIGGTTQPDEHLQANVFERLSALRESGAIVINKDASSLEQNDAQGFLDWVGRQVRGGAQ